MPRPDSIFVRGQSVSLEIVSHNGADDFPAPALCETTSIGVAADLCETTAGGLASSLCETTAAVVSLGQLLQEAAAGSPKDHGARLTRYAEGKRRALMMANYLGSQSATEFARKVKSGTVSATPVRRAFKVAQCANLLHFRHFMQDEKLSLVGGYFCQQWKLCQTCAIRRGSKAVQVLGPKITDQLQRDNQLRAYLVTVTIKNGPGCDEQFQKLRRSLRRYLEHTNDAKKKKRSYTQANKASGIYWAFEGGLGKNSGEWHWHCHAVWLCRSKPDSRLLSLEWEKITGDSFIVDVREFNCTKNNHRDLDSISRDVIEVCKYTLKPHGMTPALAYETQLATSGFHFTGCTGSLRLTAAEKERIADVYDQRPDEAQDTRDIFYRYSQRASCYQELDDSSRESHLRQVEARAINRTLAIRERARTVAAFGQRASLDTGAILGDRYTGEPLDDEPPDPLPRGDRLSLPPSDLEDMFFQPESPIGMGEL